jgi:hypothetical protein
MKVYALFGMVLVMVAAVWVAGCGGVPAEAPAREELSSARSQSVEVGDLKEETMTPIPTPEPAQVTPPPEAEQVVQLALEDLTGRLGLASEEVRLVSVEAVEWSDASLGCPQPGMMYAQVITPGFLVTLEAGGETYEYHTDTGDYVVLCQPEEGGAAPDRPVSAPKADSSQPFSAAEPPADVKAVLQLAIEDLAGRLGLSPEAIRLVSVEPIEWSDASLGCPQPGMMYAQVITPGYMVVLEAEGRQYTYHTDTGRSAVLCVEEGETSGGTGVESLSGESVTPDPQSPYYSLVIKAVEDLAGRLSVDVEEIGVLDVQEVVWPDSSLGCPLPGMAYKQVPEDGLLIRLEVDGQVYEYHSGGMRDPFLCEQTLKVKPPAIKLDLTKTIPPPRDTGDQ